MTHTEFSHLDTGELLRMYKEINLELDFRLSVLRAIQNPTDETKELAGQID